MSWLFSRALGAEFLEATCSDGEPYALLNVMPTRHPFWRNDKTMDFSGPSLFGLTCRHLTDDRGADLLTWYREDSLAKTSASQGAALDSTERGQVCGESLPGSLARYDRATHSLKTAQGSLFSDLTDCSVTLPRSGSMRNGTCYQQPTLALRMSVSGCGSSQGMFPTPTVHGNHNAPKAGTKRGTGLSTYVKKYPTPTATATAYKGWSKNHNRAESDDRIDYTIERESHESGIPGRLNPMWEEWLMAWPIGWTQLKPLEMDRFQLWRRQHSPNYAGAQDGRDENAA